MNNMQTAAGDESTEQRLSTAVQTKIAALAILGITCFYMLVWESLFLHAELMWRVNKDDRSTGIFGSIAIPIAIVTGTFVRRIARRTPSDEDRNYFMKYGRLRTSPALIPLIILLVLLFCLFVFEMYIWFFWQYPTTDWFRGHH